MAKEINIEEYQEHKEYMPIFADKSLLRHQYCIGSISGKHEPGDDGIQPGHILYAQCNNEELNKIHQWLTNPS